MNIPNVEDDERDLFLMMTSAALGTPLQGTHSVTMLVLFINPLCQIEADVARENTDV